jgi:amidase
MPSDRNWQQLANEKRESILAAIPQEWRLKSVPSAEEQRDVTGSYIQRFLNEKEKEITETDAVNIVKKTSRGEWSAVDVARAFCHRAAIAHQLVRISILREENVDECSYANESWF